MANIFVVKLITEGEVEATVGVFDSQKKAEDACRTENHYIIKLNLNEDLGDETAEASEEQAWFPATKKSESLASIPV